MEVYQNLLNEVASGSEPAFKLLFESHYEKLYKYLLRITKSKDIAEEIVLDVFLKLWIGRELLIEIRDFDAFLHKVAYNKAIDFLRIAARNKQLQKMISREMESARGKAADHKLLEGEYSEILKKAIDQLSPQRKLIFSLSRMEGLTHDQIAQQLHLSRNTIRNSIAETLKSIRQFLQQNNFDSGVVIYILFQL